VKIEFDAAKRDKTLEERGLDFADAPKVFRGRHKIVRDDRKDYGAALHHYRMARPPHGRPGVDANGRRTSRHQHEESQRP
jgi:hypothetical protein